MGTIRISVYLRRTIMLIPYQVASTGQLGTIMTFYEIMEPPVESSLSGIPLPLLKKAINILAKSGHAQLIAVADGEGVRFFQGAS